MFNKKLLSGILAVSLALVACSPAAKSESTTVATETAAAVQSSAAGSDTVSGAAEDSMTYEELVEAAKGSTVHFYGWGGDDKLNEWLDTEYAATLKEKYDITLERVPMGIEQILTQLTGELAAGEEKGNIDMIWINGENFRTARENDMIYGPFLDKMPNYTQYIDAEAEDIKFDFGYPVEGFESPYGKAQLVFITDTERVESMPKSAEELKAFVEKYPGQVTYPALPDFTGSAFVRNIIYDLVGYEQFMTMKADKEAVKKAIEPALTYLNEIEPYLWNNGKTYPDSSTTVDTMFADAELVLNMTYAAYSTGVKIEDGTYPETAVSFQFDKGTIGNTNFIAIAKNSANKAGAIVAINEMVSPEMQAKRFAALKTLPVVDYNKLSAEQKAAFDGIDIGKGNIAQSELLEKRLPEMPAELVPIIEEIWLEEVAAK